MTRRGTRDVAVRLSIVFSLHLAWVGGWVRGVRRLRCNDGMWRGGRV